MTPATLATSHNLARTRARLEAVKARMGEALASPADSVPGFTFYLGAHRVPWLERSLWDRICFRQPPLCLSYRTLREYRELPRAGVTWMLDSAGFTELSKHGHWTITPQEYARDVQRYQREIGGLAFAAQQDWMCEEEVLARTGLTVADHQRRTVDNYLELRAIAPDVLWAPTLQGWTMGDYLEHIEMFYRAGVNLHALPRVCVGTICKRKKRYLMQSALTLRAIHSEGLHNLHAFGAHLDLLKMSSDVLVSSDSTAWSTHARKEHVSKRRKEINVGIGSDEIGTGNQNDPGAACSWYHTAAIPAVRMGRG